MGNHACLHPLSWQPDISQRFACLQREPGAILLDSGQPASLGGRFDIASAWPLQQIQPQDREPPEHFLHRARQLLQQLPAIHSHAANTDDLPFTGGLIGYLGYHFGQPDSRHPRQLPDACIGLYDWALINDHLFSSKPDIMLKHRGYLKNWQKKSVCFSLCVQGALLSQNQKWSA